MSANIFCSSSANSSVQRQTMATLSSSPAWLTDTKTPTEMQQNNSSASDRLQRIKNSVSHARKSIAPFADMSASHNQSSALTVEAERSMSLIDSAALASAARLAHDQIDLNAPSADAAVNNEEALSGSMHIAVSSPSRNNSITNTKLQEKIHLLRNAHLVCSKRLSESKDAVSILMQSSDTNINSANSSLNASENTNTADATNKKYTSSSSSILPTAAAFVGIAAASAAPTAIQAVTTALTPQRRSLLSAGDMFGVGSASSAISWILTLIAGGIAISKINQFIHSGCAAEKDRLLIEFEKELEEHKTTANKNLNKVIETMQGFQEQTHQTIEELINVLEEVGVMLEQQNTESASELLLSAAEKSKDNLEKTKKGSHLEKIETTSKTFCGCC